MKKNFTTRLLILIINISLCLLQNISMFAEKHQSVGEGNITMFSSVDNGLIISALGTEEANLDIINAEALEPFFNELHKLQTKKDTVINIVQLGDSHIQAGHLSGKIRRLMQSEFGNAGRGWISPLKLSRTNEPDDYFINSTHKEWIAGRCIQNTKKCTIGPGGMGITKNASPIDFEIKIAPINGVGDDFSKIIVYRGSDSQALVPFDQLPLSHNLDYTDYTDDMKIDTFEFRDKISNCTLKTIESKDHENLYYGFNLSNGQSGILYHSIGINGAMFTNYSDDAYIRKLEALKPALLIVSLGTNETFGRRFTASEFRQQIETFITLVKKYIPDTAIILTTPPEVYKRVRVNKKRTYVRNQNTETAAKVICEVAKKENIACWDLFTICGGKGSSAKLLKKGYLNRDRVHFTKEGYQAQGEMFFQSLMNSYNNYVQKQ